jgi:peptidoglycan/xylan/chitin deacetylase (PgdA/CDA1 family)
VIRKAFIPLIASGLVVLASYGLADSGSKKTSCVPMTDKLVALTFDDGPHEKFTPRILKILKDADVKVTFFVVGKMVDKEPGLVKAEIVDGQENGDHTYNHYNLTTLSDNEIVGESLDCLRSIERAGGSSICLLRPPYGRYDERVLNILNRQGFTVVLWSDMTSDYGCTDPQKIINNAVNQARPGSIILCHDGVEATITALPEIIRILRQKGFSFVTVSGLIAAGHAQDVAGITGGRKINER